jgi:uncharacterized protein (DUF2252 family)
MNVVSATSEYESWARRRIGLIASDLVMKHKRMKESAFPFLRATFYRWCALWPDVCPDLASAPKLLAVGDLHVENFGTWRDAEGRLVWGINDFDEAYAMPYTIDLTRLATSALLAAREAKLSIRGQDAAAAILKGYSGVIADGDGKPFILEEEHPHLRAMAMGEERNPMRFWMRLSAQKTVKPPRRVRKLLQQKLPAVSSEPRFAHRITGLGSLGRPRYLAIAEAHGGMVAREAKALLPSAYAWAMKARPKRLFYDDIVAQAIRAADPFLAIERDWLLRRLAPHCTRIELDDVPTKKNEQILLEAMGRETANIHLGSAETIAAVRRDLRRRRGAWLYDGASRMAEATLDDWKAWRAA